MPWEFDPGLGGRVQTAGTSRQSLKNDGDVGGGAASEHESCSDATSNSAAPEQAQKVLEQMRMIGGTRTEARPSGVTGEAEGSEGTAEVEVLAAEDAESRADKRQPVIEEFGGGRKRTRVFDESRKFGKPQSIVPKKPPSILVEPVPGACGRGDRGTQSKSNPLKKGCAEDDMHHAEAGVGETAASMASNEQFTAPASSSSSQTPDEETETVCSTSEDGSARSSSAGSGRRSGAAKRVAQKSKGTPSSASPPHPDFVYYVDNVDGERSQQPLRDSFATRSRWLQREKSRMDFQQQQQRLEEEEKLASRSFSRRFLGLKDNTKNDIFERKRGEAEAIARRFEAGGWHEGLANAGRPADYFGMGRDGPTSDHPSDGEVDHGEDRDGHLQVDLDGPREREGGGDASAGGRTRRRFSAEEDVRMGAGFSGSGRVLSGDVGDSTNGELVEAGGDHDQDGDDVAEVEVDLGARGREDGGDAATPAAPTMRPKQRLSNAQGAWHVDRRDNSEGVAAFPTEHRPVLAIILKTKNLGLFDAIQDELAKLEEEFGMRLPIVHGGIGPVGAGGGRMLTFSVVDWVRWVRAG